MAIIISYESIMKTFSRQFPIKRTNCRGHTTIIEGPNLFCHKR
eukprot:UN11289